MDVKLALTEEQGYREGRWQITDEALDEHGERIWWLSTVFLSVDHSGFIFESLARIGDHNDVVDRYRTRVEAVHGHRFWLGLLEFMVEQALLPVQSLDEDGDPDYGTDGQPYEQMFDAEAKYRREHAVKAAYRTRTVCCAAPVIHEGPLGTGRLAYDDPLAAPPPRCSECMHEISSIYFETFSTDEDV